MRVDHLQAWTLAAAVDTFGKCSSEALGGCCCMFKRGGGMPYDFLRSCKRGRTIILINSAGIESGEAGLNTRREAPARV